MPLLAVLDESAHGALDESLKTLYVQNAENKQFYLDIGADEAAKLAFNLQKQFDAKKADLSRVHGEKTAIEQKLKAFEGLGKSADEIKEAMESNRPEEVNRLLAEKDEKHRAEVERLTKSFEEPMTAATEKAKKFEAQIQNSLTQSAIAKLRNDYDLNEMADFVLREYIKAVPKEEGSDEYTVRVFENGEPAMLAGAALSPEQFVSRLREEKKYPQMFNAGDGGGTGATSRQSHQQSGAKTVKRSEFETWSDSKKMEFMVKERGALAD